MRYKFLAVLAALVLVATGACGPAESNERTVLVDHSSDEFSSMFLYNFPEKVTVRQGDTLVFKQTWTGEPHTVTGGTTVDEQLDAGQAWFDFFQAFESLAGSGANLPNPEDPGEATFDDFAAGVREAEDEDAAERLTAAWNALRADGVPLPDLASPPAMSFAELVTLVEEESDKTLGSLASAFTDDDQISQNVGQPCYLRTGAPPEDEGTPCADRDQRQPSFDGRQSYYNSGIIPYEGPRGNSFRVPIAEDAELGTFTFFCAVHGFLQKTDVEIKGKDADIPSQGDVAERAQAAIEELNGPMRRIYRTAVEDGTYTTEGPDGEVEIDGPFAGLPGEDDHTVINEFIPERITARAGEPITWKMMGSDHTISFNVPEYFPIMEFLDDGTVRMNPRLDEPAGGAVPVAEEDGEEDGEAAGDEGGGGPLQHDGGTFDGTGFWSSGLIGAEPYLEYTLRISKPGTYTYACLIHPPMVGTIEVT